MKHRELGIFIVLMTAITTATATGISLGKGSPKVAVYRSSASQAIVYDLRPELGLWTESYTEIKPSTTIEAGIRLLCCTLRWDQMEPTEKAGLYDSTYLCAWDTLVAECRKSGVCLWVIIDGVAPGTDLSTEQGRRRLTNFVKDIAAKYNSVIYWQVMVGAIPDGPTPPASNDTYSEILSASASAIRSANPAAFVIGTLPKNENVAKALYSDARQSIDIIAFTGTSDDPSAFADKAKAVREMMAEFGDQTKPLWCRLVSTERVGFGKVQDCFERNNEQGLCQKVYVKPLSSASREFVLWADAQGVNKAILDRPRSVANVHVPTDGPLVPIGFDYRPVDYGIEVLKVTVDSLVPARISFVQGAEPPEPGKGKPGSPQPKSTRPIPDPFDI